LAVSDVMIEVYNDARLLQGFRGRPAAIWEFLHSLAREAGFLGTQAGTLFLPVGNHSGIASD